MKRIARHDIRPRSGFSGRGLLFVFLLCAQLFMPAHALGHDLSIESPASCAICPVGQNLTGVCSDTVWHAPLKLFNTSPAVVETREWPAARVSAFRSRAPPPVS